MLQVNNKDTEMDPRVKSNVIMTFVWRPVWQVNIPVYSESVFPKRCLTLFNINSKVTKGWRHLRVFVVNFRKNLQIVPGSWMFNLNNLFLQMLYRKAILKNFQNSHESNGGGILVEKMKVAKMESTVGGILWFFRNRFFTVLLRTTVSSGIYHQPR